MASKNDPYVHFVTNTATTTTLSTSAGNWTSAGQLSDEYLFAYVKKLHDKLGMTPSTYFNDSVIIKEPVLIDTYDDVEEI